MYEVTCTHSVLTTRPLFQVYLQAAHQEVLAILDVQVEPLPPRLDQLLHFYHPEKSFLKKQLSLSLCRGYVFVCCSEPEAVCEVKHSVSSVLVHRIIMPRVRMRKRGTCIW